MTAERFDELAKVLGRSTSRRAALKAVAAAILGGLLAALRGGAHRAEAGFVAGPNQTTLLLTNSSGADVLVFMTLGVDAGCVTDIRQIPFITTITDPIRFLQGSFTLANGASITYVPPAGKCIGGNYSFGAPPNNCPQAGFPNGVNLAEFFLNAPGTNFETVDDSGVDGLNADIKFVLTGGGTWNAGPTVLVVTEFENKCLLDGVGLVGVYPWGCDICVRRDHPPTCNQYVGGCQAAEICNVQRTGDKSGGTVQIIFKGFLTASTCSGACGADGQACCQPNNSCASPTSICTNGTCQPACGGINQTCCQTNNTCNTGLSCTGGRCTTSSCGGSGQNCCQPNNTCTAGLTCTSGTCTPISSCGTLNNPCCGGVTCNSGLVCRGGVCVGSGGACGAATQPCCTGVTPCNSGLACIGGSCTYCGSIGQPCCAGTCAAPDIICQSNNSCAHCGNTNEPCCIGMRCGANLTCNGTTCVPSSFARTFAPAAPILPSPPPGPFPFPFR